MEFCNEHQQPTTHLDNLLQTLVAYLAPRRPLTRPGRLLRTRRISYMSRQSTTHPLVICYTPLAVGGRAPQQPLTHPPALLCTPMRSYIHR